MESMDGPLARYGQLHMTAAESMEDMMGYIHITAYEIRTKASVQAIIMRWVF
jgi:hypothetical protein